MTNLIIKLSASVIIDTNNYCSRVFLVGIIYIGCLPLRVQGLSYDKSCKDEKLESKTEKVNIKLN